MWLYILVLVTSRRNKPCEKKDEIRVSNVMRYGGWGGKVKREKSGEGKGVDNNYI